MIVGCVVVFILLILRSSGAWFALVPSRTPGVVREAAPPNIISVSYELIDLGERPQPGVPRTQPGETDASCEEGRRAAT